MGLKDTGVRYDFDFDLVSDWVGHNVRKQISLFAIVRREQDDLTMAGGHDDNVRRNETEREQRPNLFYHECEQDNGLD